MKKTVIILACALLMLLTACGAKADFLDLAKGQDIYLVLVNKDHKLPDDWLDKIELVTEYDPWGDEVKIERATLEHFNALRNCLLVEYGIDIRLDSVYRSIADQEWLWNYFKDKYGEDYCHQYVAIPGYSEHHTGLAVDICFVKGDDIINDNDEMLAMIEEFAAIHYKMVEYGFVLRYPPDREDITGYAYEPWHLRYVGELAAAEITLRGITLEEYLTT